MYLHDRPIPTRLRWASDRCSGSQTEPEIAFFSSRYTSSSEYSTATSHRYFRAYLAACSAAALASVTQLSNWS